MVEVRVNKTDAAQRQIDVAVRLLFSNEDPVAIHTLTSAAFRILRDLSEKKPTAKTHQSIKMIIRPGKEKGFWSEINKAANFFKHADSDAEGMLEGFQEEANDFALLGASLYYQDLGYSLTCEMMALQMWFAAVYSDIMEPGSAAELPLESQNAALLSSMSRSQHLALGKRILEFAYQTRTDR
jgi:hypothetical protein